MFCKKCGAEVPDGVKFCTSCGAKMEETTQSVDNNSAKVSKFDLKKILVPVIAVVALVVIVFGAINVIGGLGAKGGCKKTINSMISDAKKLKIDSKSLADFSVKYTYLDEDDDEKDKKEELAESLDSTFEYLENNAGISKKDLQIFEDPIHVLVDALNIKIEDVEEIDEDDEDEKRCKVKLTYEIPKFEKLKKDKKTKEAIKELKKIGDDVNGYNDLFNDNMSSSDYKKISKTITSWLKHYKGLDSDDYKKNQNLKFEMIKQKGKWKIDNSGINSITSLVWSFTSGIDNLFYEN